MTETGEEAAARLKWKADSKLPGNITNSAYCARLAQEAFKDHAGSLSLGSRDFASETELLPALGEDAKLQWEAAIKTGYVPSKWLLEQEMRARRPEPAPPANKPGAGPNARTACFEDEDIGKRDIFEIVARQQLTGVCFSGGGIRSATFNLGVLQGLAQLGLLPFIDYLSSVSGGGYIHQFLAAWILRHREGRTGVEKALIPQAEPGCPPRAPEPIKWLQRYASYLTPRRGLFTADTWTMIAIWFRNTVLNQIPIVAFLAAIFFLLNLLVQQPATRKVSFYFLDSGGEWGALIVGVLIAAAVVWSAVALGRDLYRQETISIPGTDPEVQRQIHAKLLSNETVRWFIIAPWLAAALWASYWFKLQFQEAEWWKLWVPWIGCALLVVLPLVVTFAGGAWRAYKGLHKGASAGRRWLAGAGFTAIAFGSAAVAATIGYGFQLGSLWLAEWIRQHVGNVGFSNFPILIDPWRVQVVILPALLLSIPYVAIELTLGLVGREYSDSRREWLARLRAWSLLYAMVWMGLTSLALLGPYLVYFVWSKGTWAELSALIAFVVSHLTTIFAGSSTSSDGKPVSKGLLGYKPMDLLAMVAAPIAILSFLILLSFGVEYLAHFLVGSPYLDGTRQLVHAHTTLKSLLLERRDPLTNMEVFRWKAVLLGCAGVSAFFAWLFGWRVDINEFSMQSFYRNRLSRCYLGATTPERSPNPFTGFDMRSRIEVSNQRGHGSPPLVTDLLPDRFNLIEERKGTYDGPFPIFCTTLNLTTGEDLAAQERKGASFAFTPLYSGYSVSWTDAHKDEKVSLNGYVPTAEYAYADGIHLDTAVAISGAAMNPNQGYNSNPALAFLMTFFNVRLGWWISNPRKTDTWRAIGNRPTPAFALWYLLKELLGSANDRSDYVNLSDGGHFENMGLYELVRRRCKYIVVCDAEQDTEMKFSGIGIAINRCRADFGAEIDLDLRPLQIQNNGFSKAHCVVGTIHYPPPSQQAAPVTATATVCPCLGDTANDQYNGMILYMKSSLVGDEPADILAYKLQHDAFPQDSTANQWFTETQFEGYRRLGHHIAMTAICPALQPTQDKVENHHEIADLFACLYSIWYPPTPEMEQYLSQHVEQYQAILSELRERPELAGLAAMLNDDSRITGSPLSWNAPNALPGSSDYAWQFANTLLDFMYTVYTELQLVFPDNRRSPHADWWLCLFRRWCRVSLLRDTWEKLMPIYSTEFRLFAQRELKLP
jgi:hypothetical protein